MSAIVKLSSRLPGDEEINGLDYERDRLLADPDQIVCAMTWLKVKDIRRIIERRDDEPHEIPTVEIARIEPIGSPGKLPAEVVTLIAKAYEARTGRRPLPIDQVVGTDELVHTTSSPELIED